MKSAELAEQLKQEIQELGFSPDRVAKIPLAWASVEERIYGRLDKQTFQSNLRKINIIGGGVLE